MALEQELKSRPTPQNAGKNQPIGRVESSNIAIPLQLLTDKGELSIVILLRLSFPPAFFRVSAF